MKRRITFAVLAILLLLITFLGRNTFTNLLRGKVSFPKELVGTELIMEDGERFTLFRRLTVNSKDHKPERSAIFIVRFKFKNLGASANKKLSIIPAPFLMGMEGFIEKDWTINEETNEFQGIYQWSSKETAQRYPETFIFKLMTKRAAPDTVSYEVISETVLTEYLTRISG